jgi:hypothetical protein
MLMAYIMTEDVRIASAIGMPTLKMPTALTVQAVLNPAPILLNAHQGNFVTHIIVTLYV